MKLKLLLFFIAGFFFALFSRASHVAGGEITYKYIGNEKYEVTFKLYRDCREVRSTSPDFKLMVVSTGAYLTLTPTLVSIRDISNFCKKDTTRCYPSNQVIKTTKPVFEEHIYSYTLDFNGAESSFKNHCVLKLGMGECCRNNATTTVGAGNDFWVTSDIDLCRAPNNSSPVFSFNPNFTLCCNSATYLSFNAIDTADNDSLSYSFVEPLQNWTSIVKWDTNHSYQNPVSNYWPPSYNKKNGPNPYVNPPIGTYLDPQSGMLIFTPTHCSEITKMAIVVREWRKDSIGKYNQIGEIVRDVALWVISCPDNNPPLINGSNSYQFCEGTQISIDFKTDDKLFIPPPPQKPGPKDSTAIVWNYGIKGASFNYVSDTARLKTGRFTWTPPIGSASTLPYYFAFRVNDNSCASNAFSYKIVGIRVMKYLKINHELQKLKDNVYVGKGSLDTSMKMNYNQSWYVHDSVGGNMRANSFNQNFYSLNYIIKQSDTKHTTDTIVFLKNGKYIIRHSLSAPFYCSDFILDTVVVKNINMEVSLLSSIDTSVCQYSKFRVYTKVKNGQAPFKYRWKKDGKITTDTLPYINFDGLNTAFYEVEVEDLNKQLNSNAMRIWIGYPVPKFKIGNDTTICINSDVKLKAKPLTKNENIIKWIWMKDSVIVNSRDSFKTKISGIYIVKAENTGGCYAYDTIKISISNTKPELIDANYCQYKNQLIQNEIILKPINLKVYKKMEWTVLKSLYNPSGFLNPVGFLLVDMDNSSAYNFNMFFGKDIIDLGTSKKDSLKFVLTTTDTFKCESKDTMSVVLLKSPEIKALRNQSYCRNDAIDLNKNISSNMMMTISSENHTGYNQWPEEGEIINGLLKQKYFIPEGGNYLVRINASNEICTDMDSVNLRIIPNPIASVGVEFLLDSVKFTDNSKYSTSRNWYLNGALKTTNQNFVLSKTAAHLKPIKLELKNANCGFDTIFSIKTLALQNLKNEIIKIYPNPANQTLKIETGQIKPYKIEIINALGQIVMLKEMDNGNETIGVSNLSKGVYTLILTIDDEISRLRFVKE